MKCKNTEEGDETMVLTKPVAAFLPISKQPLSLELCSDRCGLVLILVHLFIWSVSNLFGDTKEGSRHDILVRIWHSTPFFTQQSTGCLIILQQVRELQPKTMRPPLLCSTLLPPAYPTQRGIKHIYFPWGVWALISSWEKTQSRSFMQVLQVWDAQASTRVPVQPYKKSSSFISGRKP